MIKKLINYDLLHGAQNYSPLKTIIKKGKGTYLFDINNKRYFDFLSAYSSINLGHCHPRLVNEMIKQCTELTLCSRAFYNEKN